MNKIKVLLVDDHAMMRDGIRALLSIHDDIKIAGEAADGEGAVAKAAELAPDVVLMDIAMPGMDGLEAARLIKKKNPSVKILFLTQYDNREYVISAVKVGASGYIPKRALGSELVQAIRAVHGGDSFLHPTAATALIEEYRQQSKTTEPYDQLTSRERQILKLIAEGRSSREIADQLFISIKTVLGHRTKLMGKLGLHNRAELVKYALRKGLVTLDS